ncbi:MAG: penicillin-binding protein 2 [Acidobacteriota bacterium]|nr:penicillin-binding protein 2 [Blastocatellia bacterium]MDW8411408.1 penicillin-binding protein 2 [Acidobacteriota bacterium]
MPKKKVFDDPAQLFFKPRGRILFLKYFIVAFIIIIGVRFWYLQIVQHEHYLKQAENNRIRDIPIPAPRGSILDREGRILVDSRPSYSLMLYLEYAQNIEETTSILINKFGIDQDWLNRQLQAATSRSRPITVKNNITAADRAWIEAHELEHPEFKVELHPQRRYPHKEVLAHVLGYVGEISEEQLRSPEFDYCKPGDIVGQAGLEKTYNRILMGKEGSRRVIVDSRGRWIQELEVIPAIPGQDIVTTIDLDIQLAAEKALSDTGHYGSVMVNDPRDGAILALVSHPSYDPNLFAAGIKREDYLKLINDPKRPLRNRPIQDRYPPGSTWKILMATAALEEKVISAKQGIPCGGGISIGNRFAQCLGSHGAPDVQRAIEVSCNGYFYRVGLKLGIERLEKWQKLFSIGHRTGIDLPNETKGNAATREWKRRSNPSDPKFKDGDMINASIGQGGVSPTPLQMMYAITGIGMKGKLARPHLFLEAPKTKYYERISYQPEIRHLHISEETWKEVSQGLWRVVNGSGTARRAQIPGFDVCGKTGTAQVVGIKFGATGEEREHAWFVGYAPKDAPEIGAVALVEHGGHGGSAAAPVVKACFEEYLRKKNGLPKPDPLATSPPTKQPRPTSARPPSPRTQPSQLQQR